MKTATELVELALEAARDHKTLYVMGGFGAPLTEKSRKRYTNARNITRWGAINAATDDTFAFDCCGLVKGLLWGWIGDRSQVYGGAAYCANGVPDDGANALFKQCSGVSTDFSGIVPGAAVWLSGHIGIYAGDGVVVEATSKWQSRVQLSTCANVAAGTLPGTVGARKWTKWGLLPWVDYTAGTEGKAWSYSSADGVHTVRAPASQLRIAMVDKTKGGVALRNYVNAGFFGYNKATGHTGPVSMLRCDIGPEANIGAAVLAECKREGDKLTHETQRYDGQFYSKAQSCLILQGGRARIEEIRTVPVGCDYCVAGVPIMRGGKDVPFSGTVTSQGWTGDELRPTWHTFAGIKDDPGTVYLVGMRTTSANMVRSSEAFNRFKAWGFRDVIKLDGSISHVIRVEGKTVSTCGDRQINNVFTWDDGPPEPDEEPEEVVYIVQKGDTLSSIARRYGTTYKAIAEYNGIPNPDVIRIGQVVRIP